MPENNTIVQFHGRSLGFDFKNDKAIAPIWERELNVLYKKLPWDQFTNELSRNNEGTEQASFQLLDSLGKYTTERYLEQILNYGDDGNLIIYLKRTI